MSEDGRYDTVLEGVDPGIRETVRILQSHGVKTCQSCEGGAGHAYRLPTVDFLDSPGLMPHDVLKIAQDECPLDLIQFRQQWGFHDHVDRLRPSEMVWSVVFAMPEGGFQRRYERGIGVELVNNAVICFEDEAIACLLVDDARAFAQRIIDACNRQQPEESARV